MFVFDKCRSFLRKRVGRLLGGVLVLFVRILMLFFSVLLEDASERTSWRVLSGRDGVEMYKIAFLKKAKCQSQARFSHTESQAAGYVRRVKIIDLTVNLPVHSDVISLKKKSMLKDTGSYSLKDRIPSLCYAVCTKVKSCSTSAQSSG